MVVRRAKLHNDASCDLSQDGRLLCVFLPSAGRAFTADVRLGVFSLEPASRGQCLYTRTFGEGGGVGGEGKPGFWLGRGVGKWEEW